MNVTLAHLLSLGTCLPLFSLCLSLSLSVFHLVFLPMYLCLCFFISRLSVSLSVSVSATFYDAVSLPPSLSLPHLCLLASLTPFLCLRHSLCLFLSSSISLSCLSLCPPASRSLALSLRALLAVRESLALMGSGASQELSS